MPSLSWLSQLAIYAVVSIKWVVPGLSARTKPLVRPSNTKTSYLRDSTLVSLCHNCARIVSFPFIRLSFERKTDPPICLETLIVRNIRWSCWSRKPRLEGRRPTRQTCTTVGLRTFVPSSLFFTRGFAAQQNPFIGPFVLPISLTNLGL